MKPTLIFVITLSISSLTLGSIAMAHWPRPINQQGASRAGDERTQQLLSIIRDKQLQASDPDRVASAINQLGEKKSVEGVDDLAELLTFRKNLKGDNPDPDTVQEIHPVAPSERYPATGALIQIGSPSLGALIRVIATHDTGSLESENAIFAVSMIFREDVQGGVSHLQTAATTASDQLSMSRLQTAANRLNNLAKKMKKSM